MAKVFFASIYGTFIVLRHVLKVTQQMDGRAGAAISAAKDGDAPWLIPAE